MVRDQVQESSRAGRATDAAGEGRASGTAPDQDADPWQREDPWSRRRAGERDASDGVEDNADRNS
eukprot:5808559-Pyramimonas_sp.AAC.1